MQGMQKVAAGAGERRLEQRFTAPERSLVAVSGDNFTLPYNLTDISVGGMAFLYLNDNSLPLTDSQMDIYLNEDLQISRLPVTVVSDQSLEDSFKLKRRCGVRFGKLTQDQRVQLRAFINRHAANVERSTKKSTKISSSR